MLNLTVQALPWIRKQVLYVGHTQGALVTLPLVVADIVLYTDTVSHLPGAHGT
jgi:hypothetical protein